MLNLPQDIAHTRILPKQIKDRIRLVVIPRSQKINEVLILRPFRLKMFELPS
jgi:hypothetical protein